MDFEEKTLEKNVVYNGKILNLRKDKVMLPNGKEGAREIVEHGGGSAVLCERDGKVLMVRQFRYAYGECVWEIPAGKVDRGEDPLDTAFRELEEECGVKAGKMTLLFTVYPSPGYTSEIIRIYRAEDIVKGKNRLDEDEFLTAVWVEKARLKSMIKDGEIKDSKTLIALLYAL
ncbi:MAG: NUDIX hydrolase [Clostridia bacterium]|nr:NUDIX hydrolase [Clostridia bacterium]